jgi:hypothetical protein
MKLSLLMLIPLLIKAFTITNDNMPEITVADDEIACRHFSFPLLVAIEPKHFDYLGAENKNGFIIKKKAEYSCGIQLKMSAYNNAEYAYISIALKNKKYSFNYEIFQLTAIKKENCNNKNAMIFCDNAVFCERSKKTICCDGNFCNDYHNIQFATDLYSFNQQKFSNYSTDVLCLNLKDKIVKDDRYIDVNNRNNATCSIITLKKQYPMPINRINKNNNKIYLHRHYKINSIINLADNEILCKACNFIIFSRTKSFYENYKQHCDNTAFIIAKKSNYNCGLQVKLYSFYHTRLTKPTNGIPSTTGIFVIGPVEQDICRRKDYSFFCKETDTGYKKSRLCCNGNNCNDYRNIMFDKQEYNYKTHKFYNNYTIDEGLTASAHAQYEFKHPCIFMRFNTTRINELKDAVTVTTSNKQDSLTDCDCENNPLIILVYILPPITAVSLIITIVLACKKANKNRADVEQPKTSNDYAIELL